MSLYAVGGRDSEKCRPRRKHRLKPVLLFTESATEKIPPVERNPMIARRKTFGMSAWLATQVRVKRWGKSPPLRQ